jgi:hypothetical protein
MRNASIDAMSEISRPNSKYGKDIRVRHIKLSKTPAAITEKKLPASSQREKFMDALENMNRA